MHIRVIHIVTGTQESILSIAVYYSIEWTYHNLFIHSLDEEYLGAIINNGAESIQIHILV